MFTIKKSDCIEWSGYIDKKGYGVVKFEGRKWYVHRLIMRFLQPEEFKKYPNVNHKCDNTKCINPAHLYCGTQADNIRDSWTHGVKAENWHSKILQMIYEAEENPMPDEVIVEKVEKKRKSNTSKVTVAITVRLMNEHVEMLKNLPQGFSSQSEFVRFLLQLYLDGHIPTFKPSPQQKNAA